MDEKPELINFRFDKTTLDLIESLGQRIADRDPLGRKITRADVVRYALRQLDATLPHMKITKK